MSLGTEWIVDAHGCDPSALRSSTTLVRLFARIVEEMDLHPTSEAVWHVFPGQGGVTGVLLLSESHLTCHTFPERGFAALNLYSCRPAQAWPWISRDELQSAVDWCGASIAGRAWPRDPSHSESGPND